MHACAYAYACSLRGILQQQQQQQEQRPLAGGDPKKGNPAMRNEHAHAQCQEDPQLYVERKTQNEPNA